MTHDSFFGIWLVWAIFTSVSHSQRSCPSSEQVGLDVLHCRNRWHQRRSALPRGQRAVNCCIAVLVLFTGCVYRRPTWHSVMVGGVFEIFEWETCIRPLERQHLDWHCHCIVWCSLALPGCWRCCACRSKFNVFLQLHDNLWSSCEPHVLPCRVSLAEKGVAWPCASTTLSGLISAWQVMTRWRSNRLLFLKTI